MFKKRRLHPAAAISSTVKTLKGIILPYIIVFIFGGSRPEGVLFQLLFGAGTVFISFMIGIIHWRNFSYSIEDEELRIEQGFFTRKNRYIRLDKIQSLDLTQGIVQRAFNLVSLKVQTAGGNKENEPEAVLDAISKEEADKIVRHISREKDLLSGSQQFERENTSQESKTYKLAFKELLILAASSGRVGVVFSGAAAILLQFQEVIPYKDIFKGLEAVTHSGAFIIPFLLAVSLTVAYIIAIINIVLKFAYFSVEKKGEDLILTSGMIEKRQLTIPYKKIQAVKISENILRQPFGYVSVYLDFAGGSATGKQQSRVMLFPLIKKHNLMQMLSNFLPDYSCEQDNFKGVPDRSLVRYFTRLAVLSVPISAALIYFFRPWGFVSLFLIIGTFILAWYRFKDAGWRVLEDRLLLRYRDLSKHTYIFNKTKIQTIHWESGLFQRKKDLQTIRAIVISGSGPAQGKVTDIEKLDADIIQKWFSPQKEKDLA